MKNIIPFFKGCLLVVLTVFTLPLMAVVVGLEKVLVDAYAKDAVKHGAAREV